MSGWRKAIFLGGLSPTTSYIVEVYAVNTAGDGAMQSEVFTTDKDESPNPVSSWTDDAVPKGGDAYTDALTANGYIMGRGLRIDAQGNMVFVGMDGALTIFGR